MATLAAGKDGMSRTAEISRQSMRAFVGALEQAGELATITQPVALDYEIGACLAQADGGPALRFTAVRGHKMPVVGNLLNSRPASRQVSALRLMRCRRRSSLRSSGPRRTGS
jgi:UbiD family decarboxylase